MNYRRLAVILGMLAVLVFGSNTTQIQAGPEGPKADMRGKIGFDLRQLNDQGLYGPPGGLRALAYEFCIPADPACEAQVKGIDPTLVIYAGSKGRVGCARGEKLCIGSTHQPEFKTVLLKLAGLPYVKQIKQCFFE